MSAMPPRPAIETCDTVHIARFLGGFLAVWHVGPTALEDHSDRAAVVGPLVTNHVARFVKVGRLCFAAPRSHQIISELLPIWLPMDLCRQYNKTLLLARFVF